METRSFTLQRSFPLLINTKDNCWHITIGDTKRDELLARVGQFRISNRKAKSFWQFENTQNYKQDLYGKPLEHDWRARRLLP